MHTQGVDNVQHGLLSSLCGDDHVCVPYACRAVHTYAHCNTNTYAHVQHQHLCHAYPRPLPYTPPYTPPPHIPTVIGKQVPICLLPLLIESHPLRHPPTHPRPHAIPIIHILPNITHCAAWLHAGCLRHVTVHVTVRAGVVTGGGGTVEGVGGWVGGFTYTRGVVGTSGLFGVRVGPFIGAILGGRGGGGGWGEDTKHICSAQTYGIYTTHIRYIQ